jgi:hypothetical protein
MNVINTAEKMPIQNTVNQMAESSRFKEDILGFRQAT